MPVRTGSQYFDHLAATPREVWLNGKQVADVTHEPAFRAGIEAIASVYDMQHQPETRPALTFDSPSSGAPVSTSFMIAETMEDLQRKREAFRLVAEATFGMMGRAPDFMNTMLSALYEGREVFARGGDRYADNFARYFEYIRENDLFLTHALITPQNDRSKSSAEQEDEFLHMGVVRESEDGLIVRGARMLATMGPIADEILIYNLPGMRPGDEKHAVAFALPVDAPGLKQICRPPFDLGDGNVIDHPLAARFEECDSLIVFDDVLVPWDRVFICQNVELCNALYTDTNVRQYTAHQSTVRGLVKLQTAVGIALEVAKAIKADSHFHVQQMLGEAVDYIEITKSCLLRSEIEFETNGRGGIRPSLRALQTARNLLPKAYPRVVEILQIVGAGGLLMLPSAADFDSPIGPLVDRYYQGAGGLSGLERSKLFKLAWDICGDAFGIRTLQYERYYAGDPARMLVASFLSYDRTECERLVKAALQLSGQAAEPAAGARAVGYV